jgi:hypothetical protein
MYYQSLSIKFCEFNLKIYYHHEAHEETRNFFVFLLRDLRGDNEDHLFGYGLQLN